MASLWLTLSVILCIIAEMIAIPLGNAQEEEVLLTFGKKLGEGLLRMPRTRLRRKVNTLPKGCEIPGNDYGVIEVPHCHVTKAKYNAELDLCLSEVIPVPGMPDGLKGYNYIAHNHLLYQFYSATTTKLLVKCPTPQPTSTATTQTMANIVKSSTSSNALSENPTSKLHTPSLASSAHVANWQTTASPNAVPATTAYITPTLSGGNALPTA